MAHAICLNCNKEFKYSVNSSKGKYCCLPCQKTHQKKQTFQKLLEGKLVHRGMIRNSLIWKFGHRCQECGLEEWRGHPIPLEVDHIDGNAGNNNYENLKLVCPNCHGITPTWKGRNKGNGRASRGLPLS